MPHVFQRLTVPAEYAGWRLDQAAAALLSEFSRSRLKQWIEAGQLTVGGAAVAPKTRLKGGEEVVLDARVEAAVAIEPEPIALSIVHADAALFIIDKPAGLVVHPGAGNSAGTLQNALLNLDPALATVPRAGLVHRLDKDTSGLLVVARTLRAQQLLARAIERRKIGRAYEAICQGALTGGGAIDAPIARHPRERTKMAVRESGRAARTQYRVLERFRAHTHVELVLDSGRTHQIRVHMAYIRAPLVGDPVYGGRPRFPPAPAAELREALQAFRRQALHAARLKLTHPETGEIVTFESPLPNDMAALLEALRADRDSAQARR